MEQIHSLVRLARHRLFAQEWMGAALRVGTVLATIALLLIIERRILGASAALGVPSRSMGFLVLLVGATALASALLGALLIRRRGRSEASAALELDARLQSGERFVTALALSSAAARNANDPFARAAIADAVAFAAQPETTSHARERFALRAPERWWIAPVLLGATAAAWLLIPEVGLLNPKPRDESLVEAAAKGPTPEQVRLEAMVRQVEQSPELKMKLNAELDAARRALAEDPNAKPRSAEDAGREAMKRMAEMEQRLSEIRQSPEAKASRDLQDALSKLELPEGNNAARDLTEALKRGDFEAAKNAAAALQTAIKDQQMPQEKRDQLAKALDQTAQQLDKLAKDPAKLAEALRSAGIDPALAKNAEALKQAIEQSKSLNDSQKQAIKQMAEASKQSQQQLQKMAQQMQQSAQECKNPGSNPGSQPSQQQSASGQQDKDGQGKSEKGQSASTSQEGSGESMQSMLSDAEAQKQMEMAAANAQSQAQGSGAMSESEADSALRASASQNDSDGSSRATKTQNTGGRGQAKGAGRDIRETAFGTKTQKQKGQKQEGDVIARQLVAGQAPVGESRVALSEVASQIAPGYERGSDDDPVPAHLREVHKQYFGDLRKRFEEKGIPAVPTKAAPAPGAAAAPGAAGVTPSPAPAAPAKPAPAGG